MKHALHTRVLSMLLAVAMVFGMLPMSVFAAEDMQETETIETVAEGQTEPQESIFETQSESQTETTQTVSEVSYAVAYYLPLEDGTYAEEATEIEILSGFAGETTAVSAKTFAGYAAQDFEQQIIAEDGTTVVEIFYDRIPAVITAEYKVEHYLQTAEGYALYETETLTGKVGEKTAAAAKIYDGYTYVAYEQGLVAADGSTVVVICYDANFEIGDPQSADAAAADAAIGSGLESIGMTIVTDDESTLAPGVTMNEIVLFDKDKKRVEMQLTTSDPSVETVHFYANYKDNQNQVYGLQTLSEQVAAMEANYEEPFKVVAGLNASYYNTTTGKPTGAFVMEGIDVTTESEGNAYAFFAVLKDGTVMIGDKDEYSKYKGQIKEAIGGYIHILKDGAVVSGLDKTTKYPRQTIGITADGKVITMTADGSQTQTVGLTVQEQAEVMLALGCVDALHLDGGNSATFGAVREGTDKFVTVNSPSGGAERAVSNTLMIVSTAVPDGTFDHAVISGEYEFFVPYTSQTFGAIGADAANGAAEIPETAVWTLSDDSFGTIAADGTFTSNGKLGTVDVQLTDNGKVVGFKTIQVVTPTAIVFGGSETTIPYGKSAQLPVTAMYGNNEALCTADSYNWTVDPAAAGTMEGFSFTAAGESSIKTAVVTAAYKHAEGVTPASITIKFGKGSDVLFDFEDGDISDWHGIDTIYEWIDAKNAENPDAKYPVDEPLNGYSNGIDKQTSSVFLASEANGGRVKNGKYSLGFRMDHTNVTDVAGWLYNYLYYTGETQVLRDMAAGKPGTRIGMWVYSPNITNVAFRIVRGTETAEGKKGITYKYMTSGYDGKSVSYATNYGIPEAGWIYVYYDLTDLADTIRQTTSLYDPDNNNGTKFGAGSGGNYYPAFLQLFTGSATDSPEDMIFYIDDITLDYSDVTDDRDAPVISNVTVSTDGANDVALSGQIVTSNLLSFSAVVADKTAANATGLNYGSAKVYVDGVDMSHKSFKAGGGIMSLSNVNLTDGEHSVAFVIYDNQGNETRVTKTLTVDGTAGNAKVYLKGRNDSKAVPEAGSVYYIDVMASDASKVSNVVTKLKLNTPNTFEYNNILCADGVSVKASYDELDFELTLQITHDGTTTGEAALVSVPVRVWAWDEAATGITSAAQFATGAIPTIDIKLHTTYGNVTFADGAFAEYADGFHTAMTVKTKLDNASAWHVHSAATLEDKAADCIHTGYTGRTYCDGCKSVVEWGTTVPATGHTYGFVDGVLKCACGKTFTGVYTDGKEYVDGVCIADGWQGEVYYQDGVKLTGIHKVPAPDASGEFYYSFDENGVCAGHAKVSGLFQDQDGVYHYAIAGEAATGWQTIDGEWYYFNPVTQAPLETLAWNSDITYEFEQTGKLKTGIWAVTLLGNRYYYYGPDYYRKGWAVIDGEDYYFENNVCLTGGYQQILTVGNERLWYYFEEDGSCDKTAIVPDGFYTDRNGYGYSKNGMGTAGLLEVDGTYYYFDFHGYALKGTYAGRLFGDDYKAFTGILEKDGTRYYYENGVTGTYGLIEFEGDYYFIYWGGAVKTGLQYVATTFCDLPTGTYEFGEDGKMLQGIVEKDGVIYFYVNGKLAEDGLYCADGEYYAIKDGKAQSGTQQVEKSFCDLPAGTYEFGSDCRMFNGILEKDGTLYYYVNGRTGTYGLFEIDGDYYYVYWGGVIRTGQQYVGTTYCDLPAGNYEFGADGKMLNGIVEKDGVLYHYVNGRTGTYGLYEVDGEYYYVYWGGVVKTGTQYVGTSYCDLPAGNYEFGEDGKMLRGVVEKDGILYYYVNGRTGTYGLVEEDGKYYYVYWGGLIKTGLQYVGTTYCDLPAGNYEFGEDGAMLNGVVEKDGTLYLYQNGQTSTNGLFEIGGKYYYAYWGGVIRTGLQYVGTTYCDLPVGNYEFGEDGAMLDGFVHRDGEIYYYVKGHTPAPGLIRVDGDYYFVNWGGKLVRNQTFFVWETNGLVDLKMNYTFDADGKIIG